MKKLVFLCVLFLGISTISFSQSKKLEQKAKNLTEKINSQIKAGDETLALSDDQISAIQKIHLKRLEGLKKMGKAASKEDKKAFNKKYFQKIFKEVLTKKQLKARKKGKNNKEE